MKKVFISSVVMGMENFRTVANDAIVEMGMCPTRSEMFGARSYTPETACLAAAAEADLVIALIGARFGHETNAGVSVSQAEFREARARGRPILVFVQDVERDAKQEEFLREVQSYEDGLTRATFKDEIDLMRKIMGGISFWQKEQLTTGSDEFIEKVHSSERQLSSYRKLDTRGVVACCDLPAQESDLTSFEKRTDDYFEILCSSGVASKRGGYAVESHTDFVTIEVPKQSANLTLTLFSTGLFLFEFLPKPQIELTNSFAFHYFSPSEFANVAFNIPFLLSSKLAAVYLGLEQMEYRYFAECPVKSKESTTVPMFNERRTHVAKIFNPLTPDGHASWVQQSLSKFGRKYALRS